MIDDKCYIFSKRIQKDFLIIYIMKKATNQDDNSTNINEYIESISNKCKLKLSNKFDNNIDNELMFSGHNAFKFGQDPWYKNAFIPTIEELVQKILTGY